MVMSALIPEQWTADDRFFWQAQPGLAFHALWQRGATGASLVDLEARMDALLAQGLDLNATGPGRPGHDRTPAVLQRLVLDSAGQPQLWARGQLSHRMLIHAVHRGADPLAPLVRVEPMDWPPGVIPPSAQPHFLAHALTHLLKYPGLFEALAEAMGLERLAHRDAEGLTALERACAMAQDPALQWGVETLLVRGLLPLVRRGLAMTAEEEAWFHATTTTLMTPTWRSTVLAEALAERSSRLLAATLVQETSDAPRPSARRARL